MKREDYLSMKSICFLWRQSRCNLEVLFGVRAEKIKNKPNDGWKIFCRIQPSGVKDPEYSNGNAVGGDECIVKSLALRCTVAWSFGVMLGCELWKISDAHKSEWGVGVELSGGRSKNGAPHQLRPEYLFQIFSSIPQHVIFLDVSPLISGAAGNKALVIAFHFHCFISLV